jgi:hypothetical protein
MMPFDTTFRIVMPASLGVVAVAFVGLGLYALVRRRPFVIHARWLSGLIVLTFAPSIVLQLSLFFEPQSASAGLSTATVLGVLIQFLVLGVLALQMRGYVVEGTTQESFRDALMSALSGLHLESMETLSSIRLPSVPAELQVAVQGWMGTGQLRLKHGGRPGLLADIAAAMNAYFNSANVKTNMTFSVVYLVMGLLMGAMVVLLFPGMAGGF